MSAVMDDNEHADGFLSTAPVRPADRRLAVAVIAISAVIFVCAAPFAGTPLPKVPAFIPSYELAFAINDLITAILLFSQFAKLRSRAVCALASGYLFTALMAVAHALTFPDLFAPGGLLDAGPDTTAWLYVFWHGGFPLAVIAYSLRQRSARIVTQSRPGASAPFAPCFWSRLRPCLPRSSA